MPATNAIRVKGLRELDRAFARAEGTLQVELREGLRRAAEPVRMTAEFLAVSEIRRMTMPWSQMRVGVTGRVVYVAPVQRGRRSRSNPRVRRPNLAGLLMDRSMQPALDRNTAQVEQEVDRVLDTVGRAWEV